MAAGSQHPSTSFHFKEQTVVVAGDGQWGTASGVPPATPLSRILFPGKRVFCDFPFTKFSCCSGTGPCILLSLQLIPSSLGCFLNANPSLATLIFQGLFHAGLECVRIKLSGNGGEEAWQQGCVGQGQLVAGPERQLGRGRLCRVPGLHVPRERLRSPGQILPPRTQRGSSR